MSEDTGRRRTISASPNESNHQREHTTMAKKTHPDNAKAHAPRARSTQSMQGIARRRDMRKTDPYAITAERDPAYRGGAEDAYVTLTNADRYGCLVKDGLPQEER
jgi:hypothetical protein